MLVLDKPAGLLSVPGRGPDKQDCLIHRAVLHWPDALVVHRLDMATSGLLIFARNKEVQRLLGDAFAARTIHKRYTAIVHGTVLTPDWCMVDAPLICDWERRPLQIVDHSIGKARPVICAIPVRMVCLLAVPGCGWSPSLAAPINCGCT